MPHLSRPIDMKLMAPESAKLKRNSPLKEPIMPRKPRKSSLRGSLMMDQEPQLQIQL
jgi:hypothetical protein